MATDLVTIATTAVLSQFLGPSAKHLGEQAVGREPKPVEPKVLLPLVQAASLESDPVLAEKWAALLANAADPAKRIAMHPSYADVLRQLSPLDAQVLQFIYSDHELADDDVFSHVPTFQDVILKFEQGDPEMLAGLDNLQRLLLIKSIASNARARRIHGEGQQRLEVTAYGGQFMLAVTPPAI
jgi:hypothetical protein